MRNHCAPKGISVVEVMIGLSILLLAVLFISRTLTTFFGVEQKTVENNQALYIAQGELEMLKFLRDDNWTQISSLTRGTTYYLAVATSTITITTTPQSIGSFTPSFKIYNGYRNSSHDLVASTTSGATSDSGTVLVTATVSWGSGNSVVLRSILTNLHNI